MRFRARGYGQVTTLRAGTVPSAQIASPELDALIRADAVDPSKVDGSIAFIPGRPAQVTLDGIFDRPVVVSLKDPPPGWVATALRIGFALTTPSDDPHNTPYLALGPPTHVIGGVL